MVNNEIKLMIQEFEGNGVEIIVKNNEVLFELYSTGMALGQVKNNTVNGKTYTQCRKDRVDQNVKNADIKPLVHNGLKYLTEEMLYDLMLEMKTDKVKPFRKWVTNEVLPTIRKTGGYVSNDDLFINTYLPYADEQTKVLFKGTLETVRKQNELIAKQKQVIVEMQPQAIIGDRFTNDDNSYDMNLFSKVLAIRGLGRNNLFAWLRDEGILRANNEPYQKYIDMDYFKVIVLENKYNDRKTPKTLVKSKGIPFIVKKLIKDGYIVTKSINEIINELDKEKDN